MPPRARHAGDVGAPEHPLRAECVVDLLDVFMDGAIGVGLARIAGRPGRLDCNIGVFGERQKRGLIGTGCVFGGAAYSGKSGRSASADWGAVRRSGQPPEDDSMPSARSEFGPARPPATANTSCRRSSSFCWCGCRKKKRSPTVLGRLFRPLINDRLSGCLAGSAPRSQTH